MCMYMQGPPGPIGPTGQPGLKGLPGADVRFMYTCCGIGGAGHRRDVWMEGCVDGRVCGWENVGWEGAWMGGCGGWEGVWMGGCVDGRVCGWEDGDILWKE